MDIDTVIKVIKSMLQINPELRAENILIIYNELFDEELQHDYKIYYDYKYESVHKDKIFDLRKKIYPNLFHIILNAKNMKYLTLILIYLYNLNITKNKA